MQLTVWGLEMRLKMDSHFDETTKGQVDDGKSLPIFSLLKSIIRHGAHKESFV